MKDKPLVNHLFIKATPGDVAFLRRKGLILIRPFLLAFNCTVNIGQTLWFSKGNVFIFGVYLIQLML